MLHLPASPMTASADEPSGSPPDDKEAEAFFERLMRGPLQHRAGDPHSAEALKDAAGLNGVGPWTLGAQLGRGGMSYVYEAVRETPTGPQHAALKLARRASAKAHGLFEREAHLLTRLGTRHVAAVLDAGTHADGRPYLALEKIEGQRVTEAARHRNVRERIRLIQLACQAVTLLHEHDVVHSDLKPEHLIVRPDGIVTVLDLGLAVDLNSPPPASPDAKKSLTPEFAAPEQILGEPLHRATDVYALGLILHEVLYGRARRIPWGLGGNPAASVIRHKPLHSHGPANSAEQALDYVLDPVLQTALQPNPHLRYASASALAMALTRALAPVSPGAAPA